jgi:hypothetical protein
VGVYGVVYGRIIIEKESAASSYRPEWVEWPTYLFWLLCWKALMFVADGGRLAWRRGGDALNLLANNNVCRSIFLDLPLDVVSNFVRTPVYQRGPV